MKELIDRIDEVIHQKTRLALMTILATRDQADFLDLKKQLDLTDGNLSSHLSLLERNNYIAIKKSFVGKRPHTRVTITKKGREALTIHLDALRELLNESDDINES